MTDSFFFAGGGHFRLQISHVVKEQFERFRQTDTRSREAGGQLYTKDPTADQVSIDYASPPRWADVRGRTSFVMNAKAAARERTRCFEDGYHCVGLWHTHPEGNPIPSPVDLEVMREMAEHAIELNTFLHIIVGTKEVWVGACDRLGDITLFQGVVDFDYS